MVKSFHCYIFESKETGMWSTCFNTVTLRNPFVGMWCITIWPWCCNLPCHANCWRETNRTLVTLSDKSRAKLLTDWSRCSRDNIWSEIFFQYLYGHEFTLITDNKPLASIFHQSKEIPPLATSWLQRWSLYLSTFNYKVEFCSNAEHSNSDGLSHVPHKTADDGIVTTQADMHNLSAMPVTSSTIATNTSWWDPK